ncbi:AraC family transcriptional regulator [Flavitalea antarctica]
MKPLLLKVPVGPQYSFSIRKDCVPYFYNRFHFHPEVEIVYIHEGSGAQFIGSEISRFMPGDMVIVGPNLSHMWRCDEEYFLKDDSKKAEATVIHFHPGFLGDVFLSLPENRPIVNLLNKTQQGLRVTGKTKKVVAGLMERLLKAKGGDRIIVLLLILGYISKSREIEVIAQSDFVLQTSKDQADKMNSIFQFVLQNFQENITLNQIAAEANISPKSFCRYFKRHTRKTFSAFLVEIRITHACKLLQQEDKAVYEVCYESGFNNISNFNRLFKKQTGRTPMVYKKEHGVFA